MAAPFVSMMPISLDLHEDMENFVSETSLIVQAEIFESAIGRKDLKDGGGSCLPVFPVLAALSV
ncbi:hypothetical protein D3C86_2179260 [compost metagenome]